MRRGQAAHQAMAARFAEYTRLRDSGATAQAAITAVGLTWSPAGKGSSSRYERAYRRIRKIPQTRFFNANSAGTPGS